MNIDFCPCSSHDSQIPEANQYNIKLKHLWLYNSYGWPMWVINDSSHSSATIQNLILLVFVPRFSDHLEQQRGAASNCKKQDQLQGNACLVHRKHSTLHMELFGGVQRGHRGTVHDGSASRPGTTVFGRTTMRSRKILAECAPVTLKMAAPDGFISISRLR